MTLELKKLLKNHLNRTAGGLKCTPANAETARGGASGSPDHKSQELNPTSEGALLQAPRWDQFFSNLLRPEALPEVDRSTTSGNHGQHLSADDEDMTQMFAGSAVVQALKAQLDKLPDIRQQRVDSLKQALAAGRYQIYPQRIATAMLADEEFHLD
jgi:flagellar biosynthesis anti-sigma factor FlgM